MLSQQRSCDKNLVLFKGSLFIAYDEILISDAIFFEFGKVLDRCQ